MVDGESNIGTRTCCLRRVEFDVVGFSCNGGRPLQRLMISVGGIMKGQRRYKGHFLHLREWDNTELTEGLIDSPGERPSFTPSVFL